MSDVSEWWSTNIIEMEPGSISLRGTPIENLIGNKSFVEMIWLCLLYTSPSPRDQRGSRMPSSA